MRKISTSRTAIAALCTLPMLYPFAFLVGTALKTQPNFTSGAAAWTPDEGQTWFKLPQVSGYWAVGFANPQAGWFVGNNGQILKISF